MKKIFWSLEEGNASKPYAKNDKTKQFIKKKTPAQRKSRIANRKTPIYPWVEAYGKYTQAKHHHQTPGFYAGSGGAIVGLDFDGKRGPVGFGLAYSYSSVNGQDSAGKATIQQGYATIYGTCNGDHAYLDLGLWGGYYNARNIRNIHAYGFDGVAKSHIHGWQFTPHLEFGYDYERNWFTLEPFAMADWVATWEHGLREHKAIAFDVIQEGRFCSLLRSEAGLRFFQTLKNPRIQVVFLEKASYAYQKFFHTGSIEAEIIDIPQKFSLQSFGTAQNLGIAEVKILFIPTCINLYATLDYQGEFGSSYQAHLGTVSFGRDY